MKLQIESASNDYIITIPVSEYSEVERKYVIEEKEDDFADDNKDEFQAFSDLVSMLQELFGVINSKHNKVGFVQGLCSEDQRWDITEMMEKSLENPKNDLGD